MRLALLLAICGAALAQPRPNPCAFNPEYRRFDFWVGEWDVEVSGQKVARSRIEKTLGGCLIVENWMPFGGGEGKSLNFYNPAARQWEQVWVTGTGDVLKVAGGWNDGAIREQGMHTSTAIHRHSFTPLSRDRVRQFCEESTDGGKTWQVAFDGLYTRVR